MTLELNDSLNVHFYESIKGLAKPSEKALSVSMANSVQIELMINAIEINEPSQEFNFADDHEKQDTLDFLHNKVVERRQNEANKNKILNGNMPSFEGF